MRELLERRLATYPEGPVEISREPIMIGTTALYVAKLGPFTVTLTESDRDELVARGVAIEVD